MRYYLAYGSNLNKLQMEFRCPSAKIVGSAEIPGYELLFKGSKTGSYLTIEKGDSKSRVPVGVWAVPRQDEWALDEYEGYPLFYYKATCNLPVKMLDGAVKKLECFIYIMHEDHKLGVPSQRYVETCLEGYKDFKFNPEILVQAIERSTRV